MKKERLLKRRTVLSGMAAAAALLACQIPAMALAQEDQAGEDQAGNAQAEKEKKPEKKAPAQAAENFAALYKCTGIYVGKNAAADGKAIIARSEDEGNSVYGKCFLVVPAETKENHTLTDTGAEGCGFTVLLPDTTCRYTELMDADPYNEGQYFAACMNEYGVAVSATVTTNVSPEYAALDPVKETGAGLVESTLAAIPACQAHSAREAVEVLAAYMWTYGSAEYNTILISDKNEAWIFEIYGGTSYCAMKLSDDCAAVFGNEIMIDWVDFSNRDDFVFSDNLQGNLDSLSTVIKDENGYYHLAQSISGGTRYLMANLRTWRGHQVFAPSQTGDYEQNAFYSLQFVPDEKISVFDVMQLFGDRYQGTPYDLSLTQAATEVPYEESYDPDHASRYGLYPIGNTRQADVHIIQTWPELPDECCQLQWLSMGNAEHCVFVPAFSGITDTFEKYQIFRSASDLTIDDSFFFMCRRNAALAESQREYLSQGLKDYNLAQEQAMYDEICESIDGIQEAYEESSEAGSEFVTALAKDMAKTQYDNLAPVYNRLAFAHMYNLNDYEGDKITFDPSPLLESGEEEA